MKLNCIASGSSGNCYLLSSDTETLILDCGIGIMEIKKALDFDLSKVVGACVTHAHLDHSKAVKDLIDMGIPVVKPYEYLNLPLLNDRHQVIKTYFSGFLIDAFPNEKEPWRINPFTGEKIEVPLEWTHTNADGSECPCYGFLIKHPELGRMLYITDTNLVKWKFKNIDHILISCNYQSKYVTDEEQAKRIHVIKGHMELQRTIDFLKVNATDRLKTVTLCHLSDRNANAEEMLAEVQKVVPWANVSVARAGLEIELTEKCPF